jgi:ribose transport system permease protein
MSLPTAPTMTRSGRAVGTLTAAKREGMSGRVRRVGTIWPATLLLFLVSPLLAPGSLASSPILSMLPFAAILALSATGQALVVQQRGFDLSLPAQISLAALLVTKVANQHDGKVPLAVAVAITGGVTAGALNGLVVTKLRITPIVATLGINAFLLGVVQWYSKGFPTGAAPWLNSVALDRTGLPNTVILASVVLVVLAFVAARTVSGRRLSQAGTNPNAVRLIGARADLVVVCAYALAGLCYGIAGITLAAYTQTPGIFVGDSYLLPSVAAVVLAGNALSGGQLKIASTAVAALFLTQLNQLVLSMGAPTSTQLLIQSAVLIVAVSGHTIVRPFKSAGASGKPEPIEAPEDSTTASGTIKETHR